MGLRDLRDDNALSQQDLAMRARVSKATIARIEGGGRPHPSTVRKLATALGLPTRQVMRHLRPPTAAS